MADDTPRSVPSPRQEGQGRNPRQGDNREPGGFRIRLSDNEMQAARALQEAFGLRSTVAVLGFSLRTLAQQLEAGQLDELVAQQRAQSRDRAPSNRSAGGGERRGPRDEARGGSGSGGQRVERANPFARPSRPQASPPPAEEAAPVISEEPSNPELLEAESPVETGAEATSAVAGTLDHDGSSEAVVTNEAGA